MQQEPLLEQPRTSHRKIGYVAFAGVLVLAGAVATFAYTGQQPVELRTIQVDDFSWVEARASSWNGAANLIIKKLKGLGVKRGQIISIDAHSDRPPSEGDAIFSAHYNLAYPSNGDLDITYHAQNTADNWATLYRRANAVAQKDLTDLIGITSSTNEGGRSVTYVFAYSPVASQARSSTLTYLEVRNNNWNAAANAIIAKIKASGALRGQVVGIDAHNNGCSEAGIFSAVLDLHAPGLGKLDIGYHAENNQVRTGGYSYNYDRASAAATTDVISFTSSCTNLGAMGKGVTYMFHYK